MSTCLQSRIVFQIFLSVNTLGSLKDWEGPICPNASSLGILKFCKVVPMTLSKIGNKYL
jgi:hypothetical protein